MPESVKKILIVAESIDVGNSSGSKAGVALIKNLAKAGFEVRVSHYTIGKVKLKGIPCYAIEENRKSFLFFLSRGARYLQRWIIPNLHKYIEQNFGFSFTLMNDRNSIVSALKNIKDFEPDLVLTLSKGASFRPHHALLRIPKWHSKWMAYIHDPYPFASYPRPYDYVESGHQQKRDFFLELSEKAKFAAFPSKLLAEWMESYYPPLKEKAVIIPHQIDDEEINLPELPDFFKKDAFTIVHAGALMSARNPWGLIRAFRQFLEEVPEAAAESQLLFLGKKSRYTGEFEKIKGEMPQLYSSNKSIPFSTVQAMQNNAAVNVILEAKGPVSPFLPGKFPHCIQAGKPILLLGPYFSESKRLLGKEYPWWSEIQDDIKITFVLHKLYQQWKRGKKEMDFHELKEYLSAKYVRSVIDIL